MKPNPMPAVVQHMAGLVDGIDIASGGEQFVAPGDKIYAGMIVGEHTRENDLEVNPTKAKQLTNFRTVMKDDKQDLPPPIIMTLEQAIAYIQDDELVEVTPQSIRLRKRHLDPHERKKASRKAED